MLIGKEIEYNYWLWLL